MASVVIIHAADDALPARALGEKLRLAKLTPIIEKAPGRERQDAIKSAAVTIALWSPRSATDQGAIEDAGVAARSKGKVLHAAMQSVGPPEPFRNENYVDLTGWRGEDDFHAWLELAKRVTAAAGVAPLPPPPPRPPSGFFQPGRVAPSAQTPQPPPARTAAPRAAAPQPRQAPPPPTPQPARRQAPRPEAPAPASSRPPEERKGGPNLVLIGVIVFALVAAIGGGGYWFMTQRGGAAAEAWAAVDRTDPAALRAFIEGEPGHLRDEATSVLNALEESRFDAAMAANDVATLEAFVSDFPRGERSTRARGRLQELRQTQVEAAPLPTEPPPAEVAVPPAADETQGAPQSLTPETETPAAPEPPADAPTP